MLVAFPSLPPQQALDDPILRQILQNIGGGHLTHKDLTNAGRLYLKEHPDSRRSGAREAAEQQRLEAREWVREKRLALC